MGERRGRKERGTRKIIRKRVEVVGGEMSSRKLGRIKSKEKRGVKEEKVQE